MTGPHTETSPRKIAKEATRQAILEAAKIMFETDGYEDTTIRKLAAAAGFSTGAVFASFIDKAEVYQAIYEHPPITPEKARALMVAAEEFLELAPLRTEGDDALRDAIEACRS